MAKETHKNKLKDRKDKIKGNKYNRKFIKRHPDNHDFITAVYCKGCGVQIKGLNDNGQLFPYGSYTEATIEFDNGSAHVTAICKECVNIKSVEDIEAMYIADLEEFEVEAGNTDGKIWDIYLDRTPTKLAKKEKI